MKDFDQLIEELSVKTAERPQMVQAMVELTYGCNLRCVHCYNPTHEAKNELPGDRVMAILDQLAAEGCLWVGFTGGELFTRSDMPQIVEHAKARGMLVSLITNATLITPERASWVRSLAPYQVDVSLYGATAKVYEAVTRVRGSFAVFVRGLDLLLKQKVPVCLKAVLMTLNVHERRAMKAFADARGVPLQILTEIHPRMDGSKEPLAYRLSPAMVFEVWKERVEAVAKAEGRSLTPADFRTRPESCGQAGRLFDCLCGTSNAAITPHGKMNLCVSLYAPQYDLGQGSVREGWQRLVETVAQSSKPGPAYECGGCALAMDCTRGTNDSWLETGRYDAECLPHFRAVAEKKAAYIERSSTHGHEDRTKAVSAAADHPDRSPA